MQNTSAAATSPSTRPIRTGSNLAGRLYLDSYAVSHRPLPKDVSFPAARGGGPRALARARRLPRIAAPPRGRAALRLLRGPADGQRPAGFPPRAGARVQGHLPALQDDARVLLLPQGRLGLSRAAGRDRRPAAARDRVQGGDRGIRDRGVQREVPRVGVRVPRGLDEPDRADRLLGRSRAPLPDARHALHRVGLVGAEAAVGQGPALRGLQGRAVLPEGRDGAVLARGLPGLRGRRGSERLRAAIRSSSRRACCARATSCWSGRRRPGRSSPTPRWRSTRSSRTCAAPTATCWPRRWSRACSARSAVVTDRFKGSDMLGARYEPPFPFIPGVGLRREGPHGAAGRLRVGRGRHGHRPHGDRVRRGRLPARRRAGPERHQPGAARTAPTTSASARTPGATSRRPTTT